MTSSKYKSLLTGIWPDAFLAELQPHSYPSQLEPSINVKVVVVHVKVLNPVERVQQFKHSYGWCIE